MVKKSKSLQKLYEQEEEFKRLKEYELESEIERDFNF